MKKSNKVFSLLAIIAIALAGFAFMPAPKKITVKGTTSESIYQATG